MNMKKISFVFLFMVWYTVFGFSQFKEDPAPTFDLSEQAPLSKAIMILPDGLEVDGYVYYKEEVFKNRLYKLYVFYATYTDVLFLFYNLDKDFSVYELLIATRGGLLINKVMLKFFSHHKANGIQVLQFASQNEVGVIVW